MIRYSVDKRWWPYDPFTLRYDNVKDFGTSLSAILMFMAVEVLKTINSLPLAAAGHEGDEANFKNTSNQVLNNIKKSPKHRANSPTPTVIQYPNTSHWHSVDKIQKSERGRKRLDGIK